MALLCVAQRFRMLNFANCQSMDKVLHLAPSHLSLSTIQRSPDVPDAFWESAGLRASLIEQIRQDRPKYLSCFISYATSDNDFVRELYAFLRNHSARQYS